MKNRAMPAAPVFGNNQRVHFDLPARALESWNPALIYAAAESTTENVISILDVIGSDYYGEGVTAKRISAALRSIGDKDVSVLINSPGGDLFEGLAIYSLLREHPGAVTVKIIGVAASAASIIAMAGDTVQMGRAAFFMVHNAWVYAAGNRHDLRSVGDYLEPFDSAMAGIYSARTEISEKEIGKLMDAESWINSTAAIEKGFADSLLDSDAVAESGGAKGSAFAARKIDIALAKAGMPRSERRKYIQDLKAGTQDAASPSTPSAAYNLDGVVLNTEAGLGQLSQNLLNVLN